MILAGAEFIKTIWVGRKLARIDIEWVAQVSLLRPGFRLTNDPGRSGIHKDRLS
jgi:hypothetical protein